MEGYDRRTYGDRYADVYDEWYGDVSDLAATIDGVRRLADGGRVLELGCGTGRICLPLAATGLVVEALDASPAMLDRLRAKPVEAGLTVHEADMADFSLATEPFAIAFVAFNTFFNLTTEAAQRDCLAAVAAHLEHGGRLALECDVPAHQPDDEVVDVVDVAKLGVDRVVLRVTRSEGAERTVGGQLIDITESGIVLRPWKLRPVGPVELDAMAADAGFRLEQRWADWSGRAFSTDDATHVSVYRLQHGE